MYAHLAVKEIKLSIKIFQTHNILNVACIENHRVTEIDESIDESSRHKIIDINLIPDTNLISLNMYGITDDDTKIDKNGNITAVAYFDIENIWIDEILIEKWAVSKLYKFFPQYSDNQINFFKNYNRPIEEYIQDESQFYCNGLLQLDLTDFFINYSNILNNSLLNYNHWVRDSHLGVVKESKFTELKKIINSL